MTTISQSRLYELNFATLPALERAFSDALSCPFLEDCLADADTLRLRFRTSTEVAGQELYRQVAKLGIVVIPSR